MEELEGQLILADQCGTIKLVDIYGLLEVSG